MDLVSFLVVVAASSVLKDVNAFNIILQLPNSNETENITVMEDYKISNNSDDTSDQLYLDFPRIGYEVLKKKITEAMEMYEHFLKMNSVSLNITRLTKNDTSEQNYLLNTNVTVLGQIADLQHKVEDGSESPTSANVTENYNNNSGTIEEPSTETQNNTVQSNPVEGIIEGNNNVDTEINLTTNNEVDSNQRYEANGTINNEINKTLSHEDNPKTSEEDKVPVIEGNNTTSEEPKKVEVSNDGVFSKISDSLKSIFHSLTNWL